MMITKVACKKEEKLFFAISKDIYNNDYNFRRTEEDLIYLLCNGPTVYHNHSKVVKYLIFNNNQPAGRFTLIHDLNLQEYVQASFFEAFEGLEGIKDEIIKIAQKDFPQCKKIIFGLNGHLNYQAGYLLNNFDIPLFGLPYTKSYYIDYFKDCQTNKMVTFRFKTKDFIEYFNQYYDRYKDDKINIRFLNKNKLKEEIETYTTLDNNSFRNKTLYWSDRAPQENYELFASFKILINRDNLIFAEIDNKPVGFLLWYPDFNQLVKKNHQKINLLHYLKYKLNNTIDTIRLTEIAVLPQYRKTRVAFMLFHKLTELCHKYNYTYFEGGFIFENNLESIFTASRYYERISGEKAVPYRRYAIFECSL